MDNPLQDVTLYVNLDPENPCRFSGLHGKFYFENGRSVEPLTLREALRIGGVVMAVDDDGVQITTSNYLELIAKHAVAVPVKEAPAALVPPPAPVAVSPEPAPVAAPAWTQERLEKVADARGIQGLRDIAEPLGVKGRSIPDLIKQILAAPNRISH